MIVGRKCGSREVTYTTWVDPNSKEVKGSGDGTGPGYTTFCADCRSYAGLVHFKDFVPSKAWTFDSP